MKHLIIIEDDPSILDMMTMILETAGYRVTGYFDGSVLFGYGYEVPDLFILDKQLSGVDGLDVCRHLKSSAQTKAIPVLMVSANPKIAEYAAAVHADDSLEKPFRMQDLTGKVKGLIGL